MIVHVEETRMMVMNYIADWILSAHREKEKMGVSSWNTVAVMTDIECVAVAQNHQAARRVGYLAVVHQPVQRGWCSEDQKIDKIQLV